MRKRKPLERRTYRRRLIRNGVLCLLLALALWTVSGCPLPQAMALRRLERQMLLEPSTIVLETYDNENDGYALLLGVTEDHIHSFALRDGNGSLLLWERKGEEPTLVALPRPVRYQTGEACRSAPMLAAVDVPQDAASARLTMTLESESLHLQGELPEGWEERFHWKRTYSMEGVKEGNVFLFQLTYQEEENSQAGHAEDSHMKLTLAEDVQRGLIPYTLEFFDDSGQVILTQTRA